VIEQLSIVQTCAKRRFYLPCLDSPVVGVVLIFGIVKELVVPTLAMEFIRRA